MLNNILNNWKKTIYRSKRYMSFIRIQECVISGCKLKQCDPHHTYTAGKSLKATDLCCIPLCRQHHHEIGSIGRESFENKYNVDISRELIKCLMKYICYMEGDKYDKYDWMIRGI